MKQSWIDCEHIDVQFEIYWQANWKPTSQPEVFDMAMKEIAYKAFVAGFGDGCEFSELQSYFPRVE